MAGETKWTRGPLVTRFDPGARGRMAHTKILADDGRREVARVLPNTARADESSDATARLFAASPDLYAALTELVERRERAVKAPGFGSVDGSDGRYVRARAALAKAEGR